MEHDDLRWFRPSDLADLKMAHPASLSSILSAVQVANRLAATNRPLRRHESAPACGGMSHHNCGR
jgi:hypothetical protein